MKVENELVTKFESLSKEDQVAYMNTASIEEAGILGKAGYVFTIEDGQVTDVEFFGTEKESESELEKEVG